LNICGDVYTIIGNPEINAIVACLPGTKAKPIIEVFSAGVPYDARLAVKEITLDMSNSMDWMAAELFPQAKRTIDRFHVTGNVLEDAQAVRMRIKTMIKEEELSKEELCRIERRRYVPKKLGNGETRLEFVSKLRYQLFKRRKDWNGNQEKRWVELPKHPEFAELSVTYEVVAEFYRIYDSDVPRVSAKPLWDEWFRKISRFENIRELQNAGRTVKNHLEGVLNYFDNRNTNAFAEGLHSRIRRMLSNSR
jgi:transposase